MTKLFYFGPDELLSDRDPRGFKLMGDANGFASAVQTKGGSIEIIVADVNAYIDQVQPSRRVVMLGYDSSTPSMLWMHTADDINTGFDLSTWADIELRPKDLEFIRWQMGKGNIRCYIPEGLLERLYESRQESVENHS